MELNIEFVYRLNCGKELFIMAEGIVGRNDENEWEIGNDLMIRVTADYYEAPWLEIQVEHSMIEQTVMRRLIEQAMDNHENKDYD